VQEAVRDLEAVMQQKDSLAASLAEAKRAGGRAAKYAHALHAEVEKLRQRSSSEATDKVEAKHTIAALQAQVWSNLMFRLGLVSCMHCREGFQPYGCTVH
jgi:uncharacterized protein YceH (UPF0502 family)